MLTVQGYFKAGRFISSGATGIPERRPVVVVVADEERSDNAIAWRRFLSGLRSIDDESPVTFERASLHREIEI